MSESKEVLARACLTGHDQEPEVNYIALTVGDVITLEVHGSGVLPEEKLFLATHAETLKQDDGFFLIFAEQWFRTRGFSTVLRPATGLSLRIRVLAHIMILLARSAFRLSGMKVFESIDGDSDSSKGGG